MLFKRHFFLMHIHLKEVGIFNGKKIRSYRCNKKIPKVILSYKLHKCNLKYLLQCRQPNHRNEPVGNFARRQRILKE
jgi:hypothetical protein